MYIVKSFINYIHKFNNTNYNLEVETNSVKARCCVYIRGGISYTRRNDLEGHDKHIVIIEVNLKSQNYLIINLYRSFATQSGVTPTIRFASQVESILHAIKNNPNLTPLVVGDFNLSWKLIYNTQHQYKNLFDILN